MEVRPSPVSFSYTTVVATKSRIDKGLLAIPVSLRNEFPSSNGSISLLGGNGEWVEKTFTAYDSSSKECRIGGLREFYDRYGIRSGDQLVLNIHGVGRYELVPEKNWQDRVVGLESKLDASETETDVETALLALAAVTQTAADEVVRSEYLRLVRQDRAPRKTRTRRDTIARETIPVSLRKILTALYQGRCQISGFTFVTRHSDPYFEVHHLDAAQGNHPKNIVVVSPNVHAQFTWAEVKELMDESGWLRKVWFNGDAHDVFQIVDQIPDQYHKEVHSV